MPPQAESVLQFWFGAEGSAEYGTQRAEWFRKDAEFDALIARRFGELIEAALLGQFESWARTPQSALAQVLLLDQFTRNAFRDSARAFGGDERACAAAMAMVATAQDQALPALHRSFVYLPFEHSEQLPRQHESVRLFSALVQQAPELASMLVYSERHRAVIARFGRFPHRNAALGRSTTAEELVFLAEPGSRF